MTEQKVFSYPQIDKWSIDKWIIEDSPGIEEKTATGRARCRICGEKIIKGEKEITFFFSLTDGGTYNPWTAIEGHAHRSCTPDIKEVK